MTRQRTPLPTIECRCCGAGIRRSTGMPICSSCLAIRDRYVDREYAGVGPAEWQRACNRYSSVEMALQAIRSEQATQQTVAA